MRSNIVINKVEICITRQKIIISNDGTFDSVKWRNSPKSHAIQITLEKYQLQFNNLDFNSDSQQIHAIISWDKEPRQSIPVNVKEIVEGGKYR